MRRTKPTTEAQAAAAIAVGWPLSAIAEQTGLSLSTVKRIRRRTGTVRGARHSELVDAARESLREALTSEYAANQGAALVRSQVAFSRQIQTQIAEQLAALESNTEIDPLKAAKILCTLATASKLTADGLRGALSLAATPESVEELPVLEVREMTEEEIAALRAQQRQDAIEMGITEDDEEEAYP